MNQHEKINYIELPAADLDRVKAFYEAAFGWSFLDYGPEYTAFSDSGLEGGFFKAELSSDTGTGAVLVVLYSADLEATEKKIIDANGVIVKPVFSFPGGRRFHFQDPNGNELAVWSDLGQKEN